MPYIVETIKKDGSPREEKFEGLKQLLVGNCKLKSFETVQDTETIKEKKGTFQCPCGQVEFEASMNKMNSENYEYKLNSEPCGFNLDLKVKVFESK